MAGEEPSAERPFSRMLEPGDPWLEHPGHHEAQALNFRGAYDGISVCDNTICAAVTALAAFYGARHDTGPLRPMYLRFTPGEVDQVGGELRPTDAKPPWPPEYDDAHHDIVDGQDAVAEHMADLFRSDPSRRILVTREEMLHGIFKLLARDDVHARFRKNARWRARKLFVEERELWNRLAERHAILKADSTVQKELRKEETARKAGKAGK